MKGKNIALLLVVALLLGVLTVVAAAAEGLGLPVATTPNAPETEPNDNFSSATWVYWSWPANLTARMAGTLDPAADVDYYTFEPDYLDTLEVNWSQWRVSPASTLSLYDRSGNLLAETTCPPAGVCLRYVMTQTAQVGYGPPVYFLKVASADPGSSIVTHYEMTMNYAGKTDPYEPNDSIATATPIDYGDYVLGTIEPCDDVDYLRFEGRAGHQVRIEHAPPVQLMDAGQNVILDDFYEFTLPADGVYYLVVSSGGDPGYCGQQYGFEFNFIDQPIYLSLDRSGQIQGISFTSGDVLRYWTRSERWEMHVDMSDLGLTGNLTVLGAATRFGLSFFLGFAGNYALEGVGMVTPQDLVEFQPTSVGENTSGWLVFRFDGSDVGLTSSGERIDALGGDCILCWDTHLPKWISTTGRARVPYDMGELVLQDEDLAGFQLYGYWGTNIGGTWTSRFDGSQYGLGAADLIGMDSVFYYDDETGDEGEVLFLSFDRQVKFGGIVFAPGDIAACSDSRYDGDDRCDTITKFFDASDAGLGGFKIDAFEVGPKE